MQNIPNYLLYLNHSCLPGQLHGPPLDVFLAVWFLAYVPPFVPLIKSLIHIVLVQPSQADVMNIFINVSSYYTSHFDTVTTKCTKFIVSLKIRKEKKPKQNKKSRDNKWVLLLTAQIITKCLELLLGHMGANLTRTKNACFGLSSGAVGSQRGMRLCTPEDRLPLGRSRLIHPIHLTLRLLLLLSEWSCLDMSECSRWLDGK